MHENYIQYPPQSTGEQVTHRRFDWLYYKNLTIDFAVGDTVSGQTSGITAQILEIHPETATTGHIYLYFTDEDIQDTFTDSEDLLVDAVKNAECDGVSHKLLLPVTAITDYKNPTHGLHVDVAGQAYMRFSEGSQTLDAVGRTSVSQMSRIGDVCFIDGIIPYQLQDTTTGTASYTFDVNTTSTVLSTGTADGDKTVVSTNKYHSCALGLSQLCRMIIGVGDDGKANVVRRGGMFDEDNGFFFELDGEDMYVVTRTNSSGSPVDTRVHQSEWNGDPGDGTGISGEVIAPSATRSYWLDFHFGARIRFGWYSNEGARIVATTISLGNVSNIMPIKTIHLPVRFEQFNNGVAASTSEMRFYGTTVDMETEEVPEKKETYYADTGSTRVAVTDTETLLLSIRPNLLFNGVVNRRSIVPTVCNIGTKNTSTGGQVLIRMYIGTNLVGASWQDHPNSESSTQYDLSATSFSGGDPKNKMIVSGDSSFHGHIDYDWTSLSETIRTYADGSQGKTFTLTAQLLDATEVSDVYADLGWREFY